MKKYRKAETERYNRVMLAIDEDMKDGRDFWSALYSQGLTFTENIRRFAEYAHDNGRWDIHGKIMEKLSPNVLCA
jgi:hypothetical protein